MRRLLSVVLLICAVATVSQNIICRGDLTVSVIIPCVPKHAPHLLNLLSHYARQTEAPKEVIISFSRVDLIANDLLEDLANSSWPFKLILIRNTQKTSAGKNRNLGSQKAKGDILMFQDADDLPHPQRVEIVKYFFSTYPIYHLMHFFVGTTKTENRGEIPEECVYYQTNNIPFRFLDHYQESSEHFPIHNGQPCILRKIAREIMWPDQYTMGEDVAYNRAIYNRFSGKTMVIKVPLIVYRVQLTSGWPNG